MSPKPLISSALLAGMLPCGLLAAELRCEHPSLLSQSETLQTESVGEEVVIEADLIESSPNGDARLSGNVLLQQQDRQLSAGQVEYDANSGELTATGGVDFSATGVEIRGEQATMQTVDKTGEFTDAKYRIGEDAPYASGHAGSIQVGRSTPTIASDISYTTCPPGKKPVWELRADRIKINHDTEQGSARNVSLRLLGVPVFYLPAFSFPAGDTRKSGFLFPELGSSGGSGFSIAQPWYWNIAENHDATFTPIMRFRRGADLQTEFRYLWGEKTAPARGAINVAWMPSDDLHGSQRWLAALDHLQGRRNWQVDLAFREVSDDDYFVDLGDRIDATRQPYLVNRGQVRYQTAADRKTHWQAGLRYADYRFLDDQLTGATPHRVLPEFHGSIGRRLTGAQQPGKLSITSKLSGQMTYFDRPTSGDPNQNNTRRSFMAAGLNAEWSRYGRWLKADSELSWTHYDQSHANRKDRLLPWARLRGGLLMERPLNNGRVQTLEPQLSALYVGSTQQDDLPLFDSDIPDLNFAWLHAANRYTGIDRWGDEQRLAASVTTRFLDSNNGEPLATFSIGQIYRLRNTDITVPGEVSGDSNSPMLAEMQIRFARYLRFHGSTLWRWEGDSELERSSAAVVYQHPQVGNVRLGWRQRSDELEQSQFSFNRPIGDRWRVASNWQYSLRTSETLELLAAVEYYSCCWTLAVGARQFVRDEGDTDTAIFLRVGLKGLGSVGDPADALRANPEDFNWQH